MPIEGDTGRAMAELIRDSAKNAQLMEGTGQYMQRSKARGVLDADNPAVKEEILQVQVPLFLSFPHTHAPCMSVSTCLTASIIARGLKIHYQLSLYVTRSSTHGFLLTTLAPFSLAHSLAHPALQCMASLPHPMKTSHEGSSENTPGTRCTSFFALTTCSHYRK